MPDKVVNGTSHPAGKTTAKKYLSFSRYVLLLFLMNLLAACPLLKKDDFLPADEARVEARAGSQEVVTNCEDMSGTPSMRALAILKLLLPPAGKHSGLEQNFPAVAMGFDPASVKSLFMEGPEFIPGLPYHVKNRGTYRFNVSTLAFDLVSDQTSSLQFLFPGSEANLTDPSPNAAITFSDIEFTVSQVSDESGSYTLEHLSKVRVELMVDYTTTMYFDYEATFNSNGLPESVEMVMDMDPYKMELTQRGSQRHFIREMSLKKEGKIIHGYEMEVRYNTAMDEIEKFSGHYLLTPVRFEGSINIAALESCDDDDTMCFNNNLDVTLKQTRLGKKIGHLEFRLHHDDGLNANYHELYLVYEDGSMDRLSEILGFKAEGFKPGFSCSN